MTKLQKIIYISNARLPSEKANAYQSMLQCESFSKVITTEFWFPFRQNSIRVKNVFEFYGVKNSFVLKQVPSLDSSLLWELHRKLGFLCQTLSFLFLCAVQILRERTDVVIYTRNTLDMLIVPLLKIIRSNLPIFFEDHDGFLKRHRWIKQKLLNHVDGIVVTTSFHSRQLQEGGVPGEKILIAPNGVKLERFASLNLPEITNDERRVLYVGNLFPWKGVYTLAEATRYLPDQYNIYIIGGSPEAVKPFRTYLSKHNLDLKVTLIDHVAPVKVADYLKQANILVLPNSARHAISELFTSPLKLFEYMAAKKPIVASDVPAIREVLTHGRNALLVEPDNPRALAKGIQIVCEQPELARRLGEQAFQDVTQYAWEKRTKKIMEFIEQRIQA
nr:glycosyltransferase family 1 protein [Desulfobacterales bacterium]